MPIAPHIPRCHHVHTNGVRCGSPSMRGRKLCYYHVRITTKPPARPTDMPSLEDGNAIQLGIAAVIHRLLTYDIDYKAAYCLLHAYKLALWNLKNLRDPYFKDVVTVDPLSDPENADDVAEPLSQRDIDAQLQALHPEEDEDADSADSAERYPTRRSPEEEVAQLLKLLTSLPASEFNARNENDDRERFDKREVQNEKSTPGKPLLGTRTG